MAHASCSQTFSIVALALASLFVESTAQDREGATRGRDQPADPADAHAFARAVTHTVIGGATSRLPSWVVDFLT